ncbi:hypothetical protein WA158_005111 [Blastocystis sp. Blastoise]
MGLLTEESLDDEENGIQFIDINELYPDVITRNVDVEELVQILITASKTEVKRCSEDYSMILIQILNFLHQNRMDYEISQILEPYMELLNKSLISMKWKQQVLTIEIMALMAWKYELKKVMNSFYFDRFQLYMNNWILEGRYELLHNIILYYSMQLIYETSENHTKTNSILNILVNCYIIVPLIQDDADKIYFNDFLYQYNNYVSSSFMFPSLNTSLPEASNYRTILLHNYFCSNSHLYDIVSASYTASFFISLASLYIHICYTSIQEHNPHCGCVIDTQYELNDDENNTKIIKLFKYILSKYIEKFHLYYSKDNSSSSLSSFEYATLHIYISILYSLLSYRNAAFMNRTLMTQLYLYMSPFLVSSMISIIPSPFNTYIHEDSSNWISIPSSSTVDLCTNSVSHLNTLCHITSDSSLCEYLYNDIILYIKPYLVDDSDYSIYIPLLLLMNTIPIHHNTLYLKQVLSIITFIFQNQYYNIYYKQFMNITTSCLSLYFSSVTSPSSLTMDIFMTFYNPLYIEQNTSVLQGLYSIITIIIPHFTYEDSIKSFDTLFSLYTTLSNKRLAEHMSLFIHLLGLYPLNITLSHYSKILFILNSIYKRIDSIPIALQILSFLVYNCISRTKEFIQEILTISISLYIAINDDEDDNYNSWKNEREKMIDLFILLFEQFPHSVSSILSILSNEFPILHKLSITIHDKVSLHAKNDNCEHCQKLMLQK